MWVCTEFVSGRWFSYSWVLSVEPCASIARKMITPEMAALIAKTQARALAGQPNAGGASPAGNPKSAAAAAAAAVAARLSSSFPSAAPRQMTTLPAPQQLAAAPQMLAAPHLVAAAITGQISSAPTSSFKRRPDNWPPVSYARFGVMINGQQATPGMARHDMLVTVPVVSRLIGSQVRVRVGVRGRGDVP